MLERPDDISEIEIWDPLAIDGTRDRKQEILEKWLGTREPYVGANPIPLAFRGVPHLPTPSSADGTRFPRPETRATEPEARLPRP